MEKEEVIRPSLLAADFLHLKKAMDLLVRLGISTVHFDVMDGNFVEDISFGEHLFKPLFEKYRKKIRFDVHLMVKNPLRHLSRFYDLGAREISVHYEASLKDMKAILAFRREHEDLSLGLAFSPETKTSFVLPFQSDFDFFLVMSVVPGKGGQKFLPGSLEKIEMLHVTRKVNSLPFRIMVDGGIDSTTGPLCLKAGADCLVAGSSFFHAEDPALFLRSVHEGLSNDKIE